VAEAPGAPESLVPHRGPALLLRRVLAWESAAIVCVGLVPEDSPFVRGGLAPAFLGLELAAQSAAALHTLERAPGVDGPRSGYLVGVREARFACASLPAGRELRAFVRRRGAAGPLAVYEVRLEAEGVECLVAQFSTYAA